MNDHADTLRKIVDRLTDGMDNARTSLERKRSMSDSVSLARAAIAALEAGRSGEAVAIVGERGDVSWRSERILPVGTPLYAAAPQQPPPVGAPDREADRRRFPDQAFNDWLDMGISDCGHTVWNAVGDVQAAWQGWEARGYQQPAPSVSEGWGPSYKQPWHAQEDAAPVSEPAASGEGPWSLTARLRVSADAWAEKGELGHAGLLREAVDAIRQQPVTISDRLGVPELPKCAAAYMHGCNDDLADGTELFTAEQMRAYAIEARRLTTTGQAKIPVPTDVMEARAQGRSEAVAILLRQDAETFPEGKYLTSSTLGDSGEYDTHWNEKALHELFRADDAAWSLLQDAEGEYWHNLGLREEAQYLAAEATGQGDVL